MIKGHLWLCASLTLALLLSTFGMAAAEEPAQPNKLNPYTGDPEAIKQGRTLYLQIGCSGCHGVGGGGGMGPALLDDEGRFRSKACPPSSGRNCQTTTSGKFSPMYALSIKATRARSIGEPGRIGHVSSHGHNPRRSMASVSTHYRSADVMRGRGNFFASRAGGRTEGGSQAAPPPGIRHACGVAVLSGNGAL